MRGNPRRLSADVTNPCFDRRRRHGLDAKEVFKAGTLLLHLPETATTTGRTVPAVTQIHGKIVTQQELQDLLFAASIETTPRTIEEVLAVHDMAEWGPIEVLKHLARRGVVSMEQIDAAAAAVNAAGDEPASAPEGEPAQADDSEQEPERERMQG